MQLENGTIAFRGKWSRISLLISHILVFTFTQHSPPKTAYSTVFALHGSKVFLYLPMCTSYTWRFGDWKQLLRHSLTNLNRPRGSVDASLEADIHIMHIIYIGSALPEALRKLIQTLRNTKYTVCLKFSFVPYSNTLLPWPGVVLRISGADSGEFHLPPQRPPGVPGNCTLSLT